MLCSFQVPKSLSPDSFCAKRGLKKNKSAKININRIVYLAKKGSPVFERAFANFSKWLI
jgi:hypothetical protein